MLPCSRPAALWPAGALAGQRYSRQTGRHLPLSWPKRRMYCQSPGTYSHLSQGSPIVDEQKLTTLAFHWSPQLTGFAGTGTLSAVRFTVGIDGADIDREGTFGGVKNWLFAVNALSP